MLHKWIIPIVLFIGFIVAFPLTALSQKTLRLDLKKEIGYSYPIVSSLKSSQKMVSQLIVYRKSNNEKLQTLQFKYDNQGKVAEIKGFGITEAVTGVECGHLFFERSGNNLTLSGYALDEQGTVISPKLDVVNCTLNEMGYIIKEQEIGDDSYLTFEYDENGYTQSYTYHSGTYTSSQDYTWEDGNIQNGNGGSDEYYIYTNVINKSNIDLSKILDVQTFQEDVWWFAVAGFKGNPNKNLLQGIKKNNSATPYYTYKYQFDENGYVIRIESVFGNDESKGNYYIISYDGDISPDPTPDNNPTTEDELGGAIDNAPEGTEDSPTEIFIPSGGITLHKPLNVYKHIRLKGGSLIRGNDNPYAMLRIHSGYSLELDDITIDGNGVSLKDGSLIVYGKLKLKDGVTIKNCKRIEADTPSGAVCIAKGGELTMDGGTITGNIGAYGSAVYNEGIFTMTDGEISSNTGQIGAVANNGGGQFIMTGGKISSNKVTDGCGGVFVSEHCFFRMTGGEISENEDCALYTWANLQIGGQAKVDGLTLMNDGNRLLINPSLRNNWQISYVETPPVGTIVAVGYNGYQLADSDLQKVIYYNNVSQLKLAGNSIVTYQTETNVNKINTDKFRLSVFGNQVKVEGLLAYTRFIIYEIRGRAVVSHITDGNGQYCFSLENGIYLLTCKDQKRKFLVK